MSPEEQSRKTRELCGLAPVIPVLVVDDASCAEGLATALIAGGLPVLEVTLRTPAALQVIREMSKLAGGHVGAGTVLTPEDATRAKKAGASFAVSPGWTEELARACRDIGLPLLPGVATASEVMRATELGYSMLKFFPAEAAGGTRMLASFAGPLPQVSFCPTGGITSKNAPDYLGLPNVICVGGSWVAPSVQLATRDWKAIEAVARQASNCV